MTLPNVFIVGAPKCGTTAWVQYLSAHPDVFFCQPKEPHYFNEDFDNFRWYRELSAYQALFAGAEDCAVRGEASVMYLLSQRAAQGIKALVERPKILIFLRRQETFLPAYHRQQLLNGDENIADFEQAWRLALSGRVQYSARCRQREFLQYHQVATFYPQVKRYLDNFGEAGIRIIWYEDWVARPEQTHRQLLEFLQLDSCPPPTFEVVNAARAYRFPVLARLTQNPAAPWLRAAKLVSQLLGRDRLAWAAHLRRWNTATINRGALRNAVKEPLQREIVQYFQSDVQALETLDHLALARGCADVGAGAEPA